MDLILPQDINYSCQGCGKCCSGWSVGMTMADYANVKDTDWQSLHPALAGKTLFLDRQAEFEAGTSQYPFFTNPTQDNVCPFLIDDLCFIHGLLGADKKPMACQIFPYAFAETPAGVYAGVYYSSKAAVRNMGVPLSEQRQVFQEYLDLSYKYHNERHTNLSVDAAEGTKKTPFDTIALTPACQLTWQEYSHFENRAMQLIKEQYVDQKPEGYQGDIFRTLAMLSELVLIARNIKTAGADLSQLAQYQPTNKIPADTTMSSVEHMTLRMLFYRYYIYPQVRAKDARQGRQKRADSLKSQNLMGTLMAFGKFAGGGLDTIVSGKPNIENLGKVDLEKAMDAPFAAIDPEITILFHRWLYLKLFLKTYFGPAAAGFSVLSGINNITAALLCVILHGKASAMAAGKNSLLLPQAYENLWRLDRELLTLSQIAQQESRIYNSGLSAPRLFNKGILALEKSFQKQ